MTDGSFVHLHCHTEYSMLDGAAKIPLLFAEARRLSMPAVAVTDHGNMFGVAEFYLESQKSGVKPVIGIEAYVAPGSRHHKRPVFWGRTNQRGSDEFGEGGDVSGAGAYTHMTMLATNATGLRNLFRLSSLASFEGHYRKPRMDRDLIAQHAEGVIATTGCPSGEVQTRLRLGQRAEAMEAAAAYRDIVGPGNFFLELMDHGLPIERSVREGLLDIGRALGLPPLATNDSHYVTQDQAGAHAALLCVQTGRTLTDPTRFRFEGDGYYLKSAAEMRAYWDTEVPGACDNTLLAADRVESYADVFAPRDRKPRVPLAVGDTEDAALRREVDRGAAARFPGGLPASYRERLDTELAVTASMGFAGYFLVVADLVRWALGRGVLCRARGSAAGSLVLYMLAVTDMDPMVHDLFFERFLNPDRVSPPDVDVDVDERHRGELVAYLTEKWGAENVARVIAFGTMKTKAAIKGAARVLGHPYAVGEKLTKALPPAIFAQDVPLSAITDPAHERHGECAAIREMITSDPRVERTLTTAHGLEGLIRTASVHPCGVFLSAEPLIDVLPLWARPDDGAIVTGWGWSDVEDRGLLKLDVLGSDTLSVITDTLRAVEARRGVTIELSSLGLDDPATYALLAAGDALGVFQMEGAGARDLLRRIRPSCFADICAATALYRPGPMGAGTHHEYAARKNGHSPVTPIHPELAEPLADILADTYQLTVYQEDIMAIARRVAGYTLGQADLLRRAMGKKKPEILLAEYERFRGGMAANGYSVEATEAVWDVMLPYASYGFVRSHAASYGLVTYWTAYLKAHYPTEFMAARLTSIGDDKDRAAVYLGECRRLGVKVLPPDVNDSGLAYVAVGGGIRFGLGAVRNVGENMVAAIIKAREARGRFESFPDFLDKVDLSCCNKRAIESLIKSGAFDSLGHTRRALVEAHADAVGTVVEVKRRQADGQLDLFAGDVAADPLAHLELGAEEYPRAQLLAMEREMLGLYVSAHPLDGVESVLRRYAASRIASLLGDAPREGEVAIAGMIIAVDRKTNRRGQPWAVLLVEDLDASIEVVVFARDYAALAPVLAVDVVVGVRGRVNWRDDVMSIVASSVTALDIAAAGGSVTPLLVLRVDPARLTREAAVELRVLLAGHPGDTPIRVLLTGQRGDIPLVVDRYRVAVTPAFLDAVKGIDGVAVEQRQVAA